MRLPAVSLTTVALAMMTGSAADRTIEIRTFQFAPETVSVKSGTRVVWMNGDQIEHTVTAGRPERRDSTFGATLRGQDASYAYRFEQPGTYPYFCDRHHFMRGAIHITR
jgi:plastocyanin